MRKAWQPENDVNDTFNFTLKYKAMIYKREMKFKRLLEE